MTSITITANPSTNGMRKRKNGREQDIQILTLLHQHLILLHPPPSLHHQVLDVEPSQDHLIRKLRCQLSNWSLSVTVPLVKPACLSPTPPTLSLATTSPQYLIITVQMS